jgi:hypothetical protein
MKQILASGSLLFSSSLFASVVPSPPQQVPVLDNWGLISIGAVVALAGVIAIFRTRK